MQSIKCNRILFHFLVAERLRQNDWHPRSTATLLSKNGTELWLISRGNAYVRPVASVLNYRCRELVLLMRKIESRWGGGGGGSNEAKEEQVCGKKSQVSEAEATPTQKKTYEQVNSRKQAVSKTTSSLLTSYSLCGRYRELNGRTKHTFGSEFMIKTFFLIRYFLFILANAHISIYIPCNLGCFLLSECVLVILSLFILIVCKFSSLMCFSELFNAKSPWMLLKFAIVPSVRCMMVYHIIWFMSSDCSPHWMVYYRIHFLSQLFMV